MADEQVSKKRAICVVAVVLAAGFAVMVTPMRLARTAAINAVRTNFALPLRVAGVDAAVAVRFIR